MPLLSRLESLRKGWRPEWADWVSHETVEAFREQYMPELPPIERGAYLIGPLFDIGPVMNTGMGAAPITSRDLIYWQQETGVVLQPWEARVIRRLSSDYASESHKAEARDTVPPWQPEITEDAREKIERHIKNIMRG